MGNRRLSLVACTTDLRTVQASAVNRSQEVHLNPSLFLAEEEAPMELPLSLRESSVD